MSLRGDGRVSNIVGGGRRDDDQPGDQPHHGAGAGGEVSDLTLVHSGLSHTHNRSAKDRLQLTGLNQ